MNLMINDKIVDVETDQQMPLLWVLRDELQLTGTKYGCGIGNCGACTILVDGIARRSCTMTIGQATGKKITTIEHFETEKSMTLIQKAWIEEQVPQCGYCQSGMIAATEALLRQHPDPTDEDINRAITNICRCGTYPRIRRAIKLAAQWRKEQILTAR
ncbi:MAG: (2Fe-2S)-binding protein [Bacteroidota bacterium]